MTIEIGTTNINKLYVGSTEIKKAQLGLTTVYDKTGGGGGGNTMQDVVASAWVDLDATIIDSYGGSGQTWSNLVATPSGGGTQTDFDAWLGLGSGSSTDDPTFTGTAGDGGAYFSMDGGDVFALKSKTAGVLNSALHDDSTDCWFAIAFESNGTTNHGLFGNTGTTGATSGVMGLYQAQSPRILSNHAPNTSSNELLITSVPDTSQNWVFVVQFDKTNGLFTVYHNGTKSSVSETYATGSTVSPTGTFYLGSIRGNSSDAAFLQMPSGSKYRAFSAGNSLLSDSEAADILAEYNIRHGSIYS